MKPIYSICIANYNMADTLEVSLRSVLNQVDNRYEVLVIDDGSNDSSLSILNKISREYENFRYIPLLRDKRRKLGETRNISIEAARGEYVILHIDTDDKWEPYIDSFTRIFHDLSLRLEIKNFMLSGFQIHMAPRTFLLNNKFPNVYYTEDRLLWSKLASKGALICIKHKVFRKRIPLKTKKKKLIKVIKSLFSSMVVSFSYHANPHVSLFQYFKRILGKSDWSFLVSLINLFLILPAYLYGVLFNRDEIINGLSINIRKFLTQDLKITERKYLDKFGHFNLSDEERKLYFLD